METTPLYEQNFDAVGALLKHLLRQPFVSNQLLVQIDAVNKLQPQVYHALRKAEEESAK